jgi:hypothetical protein
MIKEHTSYLIIGVQNEDGYVPNEAFLAKMVIQFYWWGLKMTITSSQLLAVEGYITATYYIFQP